MVNDIVIVGIGNEEDWSCYVTSKMTKKRVYVIDTGGTYELCHSVEVYSLTGNHFAEFGDYQTALKLAQELVEARPCMS